MNDDELERAWVVSGLRELLSAPRVPREPEAIVWAWPTEDCYGCRGTGWQVGYGARPRTVQCPCTRHVLGCEPDGCDEACPSRRALELEHW